MSQNRSFWEKLLFLRDEMSLQAHLMNLDLHDEWRRLEKRCVALEQKLEKTLLNKAKQIGEAEEEFFVGDKEEIEALINDMKSLQEKNKK